MSSDDNFSLALGCMGIFSTSKVYFWSYYWSCNFGPIIGPIIFGPKYQLQFQGLQIWSIDKKS